MTLYVYNGEKWIPKNREFDQFEKKYEQKTNWGLILFCLATVVFWAVTFYFVWLGVRGV